MFWSRAAVLVSGLATVITAIQWAPEHVGYNLNENQTAVHPADYWGQWDNHTYNPSPKNWRFPFVVQTIDRYLDGDPTNNEANGTVFEHNWMTNQFRFGGDVKGFMNDLDYIHGMGVRGIYIAGTPFLNMPWSADGYGPLDFTLLDPHHGTIEEWRALITEIHRRDMYVLFDNTMATMGDLIAFDGSVNASAGFRWDEYDYVWKTPDRRYHDFHPGNERNKSCEYPRIWGQDGYLIGDDVKQYMDGCRDSEFDAYGDIKGTGAYPSWRNQLSKFASVQDRLREWRPDVLEKLKVMTCIQIAMFDIDGIRMDKALQTTIDAMVEFGEYQKACAKRFNKDNFLFVGEVVGDPRLEAVFIGRGKQPNQALNQTMKLPGNNVTKAVLALNDTDDNDFIRPFGKSALDGVAFHYDIYGAMTRFLGLDGPWGSRGVDWVEQWTRMVTDNDMINQNTGEFDPRHFFGMTDVFRWPSLKDGIKRQYQGFLIVLLELPGIPMTLWGEEQEFYILENLAEDYVFGRTPMGSSRAWQIHGCYHMSEDLYYDMPFDPARNGCHDDSVSLDHRDPSHPTRNVIKRMYELRRQYPILNDGFNLLTLSTRLHVTYLPGSGGIPSPFGIWSVYRGRIEGFQDFSGIGAENQGVWFLYSNENHTVDYNFDCGSNNQSDTLISAFPAGSRVKNLFHPYEEYTLEASPFVYGIENSTAPNGCLSEIRLDAWEYKAFVPKDKWEQPGPTITRVIPGHDARLRSNVAFGEQESVKIEIRFSSEMNCESVTNSLEIRSTTLDGRNARLNKSSVACTLGYADPPRYVGEIPSAWTFSAELENVSNGVHTYAVNNATTADGLLFTNALDRFMFRIGQDDNPMVFPWTANYTRNLLHKDHSTGDLYVSPRAPGADKFRYSTNWGSSWSDWMEYTSANTTLTSQPWSGTKQQEWEGQHVILNFWSAMTASSEHIQHSDLGRENHPPRRWPHAYLEGSWNQYGYDGGLPNEMAMDSEGLWTFDLVAEWPTELIVNVWGVNPDGYPDKSAAYGDVDGDGVLDWVPPDSLARNVIEVPDIPTKKHLGYKVLVNDGNFNYQFVPVGSSATQAILAILIGLIPLFTACLGVWSFMISFYHVKFNEVGVSEKGGFLGIARSKLPDSETVRLAISGALNYSTASFAPPPPQKPSVAAIDVEAGSPDRRIILIATMEYEIEDWNIKIKIGGLGVMSSLMGKNLGHQDLIWVVPCVGGLDYPIDMTAPSICVTILGKSYEIEVQYHVVRNITFVLLDAPVFRKQTKADPYPARMDDLESAIYYSAWNQCIAEALRRFPVDLYHINDYHGCIAQLHLLPEVIPCALSLHNAEFQGMWSLKTNEDMEEICQVYNLSREIVEKYVQYGEVFNLLHAGASYLRVHQKGFGSVGVSAKYGKRALMRYPIFWGLSRVGALPNPDPSDTGAWNKTLPKEEDIHVNTEMESGRGERRREAQEWAGLNVDPTAELFVFVGRWSQQKGVDLIADVFFSILEEHPKTQLICVGPVIDLYGKFAALKLAKMMKKFPGRVYSKPEFTALPACIFSGAEFSLIPSRDEPFGLVAVEFGRKGALGVGARVGGLGQMPGWWFTVESTTSKHLIQQFKSAIRNALASKTEVRAIMRARSALQRFPVQQWVEDLEKLQSKSIAISIHQQKAATARSYIKFGSGRSTPTLGSPIGSLFGSPVGSPTTSAPTTAPNSRPTSRPPSIEGSPRNGSPASMERRPISDGSTEDTDDPQTAQPALLGPSHALRKPPLSKSGSYSRASTLTVSRNHISSPSAMMSRHNPSPSSLRQTLGELDMIPDDDDRPGVIPYTPGLLHPGTSRVDGQREFPFSIPPQADKVIDYGFPAVSGGIGRPEAPETSGTRRLFPFSPATSNPQTPLETPMEYDGLLARSNPRLSVNGIIESSEKDFKLQKVDPFFKDSTDEYYNRFEKMLDTINPKSSERELCIEDYLSRSEKEWFGRFLRAKLGNSKPGTPAASTHRLSPFGEHDEEGSIRSNLNDHEHTTDAQFQLGDNYTPPTGLKKFLQRKIRDWQIYTFLLAFGQILAANSYQITLLAGENGQAAEKLYIVASIYLAGSLFWWCLYRNVHSVWLLATPFILYGLAFFIIGLAPYAHPGAGRSWIYNTATGIYALASSSGSFYFALNFGTEGGTPAETWAFRACAIQGTQQIYVAILWYWGDSLTRLSTNGVAPGDLITQSSTVTAVTTPIAVLLWAVGVILFLGLPDYYRQDPGQVPSFYSSVMRRKIVLWFFVMVLIQNYWLSAPYGRSWRYLWSSHHAPAWSVALLMIVFFVGVWALSLFILGFLSKRHSWIIPIFAIGLGAPRWGQMLWGTSSIGLYVPWGSRATGALLGRSLWLWLGVLDNLQGIGFGMILLQTLTRFHVIFSLVAAQVLGSLATIAARATAPDATGPGSVFPDFALGFGNGIVKPWFWGCLCFQLVIPIGFFMFFRKEQLFKP